MKICKYRIKIVLISTYLVQIRNFVVIDPDFVPECYSDIVIQLANQENLSEQKATQMIMDMIAGVSQLKSLT